MVIGPSGVGLWSYEWQPCRTTAQRESDSFITSMITDRIGRHEVLLPINHKNYNSRETRIAKLWKKGKIWIKRLTIWLLKPRLWLVNLNYNFECDWFIELPDSKLSDNNLASELVENRSFLNQSQWRKL